MEKLLEEMTYAKFEKIAEVKANYDMMIKRYQSSDKHADKIESTKAKKEDAVKKAREANNAEKEARKAEIN